MIENHETQKNIRAASGRKPKEQCRAAEFRQGLVFWQQSPPSLHPSLRELARQLDTSHQLLQPAGCDTLPMFDVLEAQ